MTSADDLAYYAEPGLMTRLSEADAAALPDAIAALVSMVQGVLVHRAWLGAYRVEVDPTRLVEEGLHAADAMIARIRSLHDAPLTEHRPPGRRMLANCRHFSTMLTAFLRAKGVPARARCGFATYFEAGKYVDHWVCEYWDARDDRWRMVDAQLDALQRAILKPAFDTLDVPDSAFWVAGKAWQACRSGAVDPHLFGIADMWGEWYVGGNLTLDIASLNKIELLPWDAKILATQVNTLTDPTAMYDRLSAVSLGASTQGATDVRALYAGTEEVRVSSDALRSFADADASGAGTGINPLAG